MAESICKTIKWDFWSSSGPCRLWILWSNDLIFSSIISQYALDHYANLYKCYLGFSSSESGIVIELKVKNVLQILDFLNMKSFHFL